MQCHTFITSKNENSNVWESIKRKKFSWNRFWGIVFFKKLFQFFKNSISFFQLSVTHDDIFGDYSCEATNKMGKLTRKVTLSEGAKAGIPMMQIAKVNRESTTFTILVREF